MQEGAPAENCMKLYMTEQNRIPSMSLLHASFCSLLVLSNCICRRFVNVDQIVVILRAYQVFPEEYHI